MKNGCWRQRLCIAIILPLSAIQNYRIFAEVEAEEFFPIKSYREEVLITLKFLRVNLLFKEFEKIGTYYK